MAPDGLVFSNTSTLPVARLAEGAACPRRMAITHYFNPAELVPLVEVLPHPDMPAVEVERAMALMRAIGKLPVLLRRDVPGFVANRLQAALMREAFHLLEMGVADARDIDTVITDGPGVRWPFVGPLETADLGGLDVWRRVIENLAPVLGRARRRRSPCGTASIGAPRREDGPRDLPLHGGSRGRAGAGPGPRAGPAGAGQGWSSAAVNARRGHQSPARSLTRSGQVRILLSPCLSYAERIDFFARRERTSGEAEPSAATSPA